MKKIHFILLTGILLQCIKVNAQEEIGFAFLSNAKTKMEETVKKMNSISDTSTVYREYYVQVQNEYIKCSGKYNAYKGNIINCILGSKSNGQCKKCLTEKVPDLETSLSKMSNLTDTAYREYFHLGVEKGIGSITGELASGIITGLIDGALKIWDKISNRKIEEQKLLLEEINSSKYNLASFSTLINPPQLSPKGK